MKDPIGFEHIGSMRTGRLKVKMDAAQMEKDFVVCNLSKGDRKNFHKEFCKKLLQNA